MDDNCIKQSFLYEETRRRLKELKEIRAVTELKLKNAPEGIIHVISSSRKNQYYVRQNAKDKSGTYISRKQTTKIKKLLQKQYDEQILKALNNEITILERLINSRYADTKIIQQIYSNKPEEIKKYITPIDYSEVDYINAWKNEAYAGKEVSDNVPMYVTDNGERVRSKSELNIANMLYKFGVAYKYECPLKLNNGRVIYPDFTVLDVKNRKEVYWEHRGMMDDREYSRHTVKRIKEYNENGYFLGDNLIITEELSSEPLGTSDIKRVIQHYFL